MSPISMSWIRQFYREHLRLSVIQKEAALSETGDLLIPIAEGIITEEDVLGSLGDVINGKIKGRENDEEIIVYETVGVALRRIWWRQR